MKMMIYSRLYIVISWWRAALAESCATNYHTKERKQQAIMVPLDEYSVVNSRRKYLVTETCMCAIVNMNIFIVRKNTCPMEDKLVNAHLPEKSGLIWYQKKCLEA